jgi:hypothetical protein
MEIIYYIFGKIVDYIPAYIQSRMFPPKKIARQIEIRLRGENSISPNLGASVPYIDLYFEIINHSYLNLVLDRLIIDFWFGQPTFQGAILKRYVVPASNTVKDIFYRQNLSIAQQKQIEQFSDSTTTSGQIHIYLSAYFESKASVIEVQSTIERNKV